MSNVEYVNQMKINDFAAWLDNAEISKEHVDQLVSIASKKRNKLTEGGGADVKVSDDQD